MEKVICMRTCLFKQFDRIFFLSSKCMFSLQNIFFYTKIDKQRAKRSTGRAFQQNISLIFIILKAIAPFFVPYMVQCAFSQMTYHNITFFVGYKINNAYGRCPPPNEMRNDTSNVLL